jgi:CRP/FNR family transcriptional regulator, cyclic AMP receptor protein
MAAHDIRELLEQHPFFAGLDGDTLTFIAGCGTIAHFAAGEQILEEGQPADRMYVIRAGHVALEVVAPDRDPLVVDTLGAGEILGVSWLVPPYRWSFDAHALEPTRAISLDAVCLRAKCDDNPVLGYALMQRLAGVMQQRLRSARVRLLDVYSHARAR